MWEEPSCWLEANWKVPNLDPSLPAPPSSGEKNGQREKKEHLIKIFKMEQHETDLPPCEKKKTHTDCKDVYSLSRVSKEKKEGD